MSEALKSISKVPPLEGNDVTTLTKCLSDSTIRVRECRQRKKLKLVQRTIRISQDQVMKLIALGYLGSRGDEKFEAIAIEAYLADNL